MQRFHNPLCNFPANREQLRQRTCVFLLLYPKIPPKFFDSPVTEIKHMLDKSSVVYGFVPFNSDPAEVTFQLTGLKEVIGPLRKQCKW